MLYADLYEAAQAEEMSKARGPQEKVLHLGSVVYEGSEYGASSIIGGIKSALAHTDICNDYVLTPLRQSTEDKAQKISALINEERSSGRCLLLG